VPQESRMERVMSGLSAMERSKLVLDSFRFGTKEDPLIRRMMPLRQQSAFNDAIYRMNAANMHIAQTINLLDADMELQWERMSRLQTLANWSINLEEIEDAIRDGSRSPRGSKRGAQNPDSVSMTGLRTLLDFTPEQRRRPGEDVPGLDELMVELEALVLKGFNNMWPILRAQEIVLEEFSHSFGGIDPLKPAPPQAPDEGASGHGRAGRVPCVVRCGGRVAGAG
jgi:hypothetical protein